MRWPDLASTMGCVNHSLPSPTIWDVGRSAAVRSRNAALAGTNFEAVTALASLIKRSPRLGIAHEFNKRRDVRTSPEGYPIDSPPRRIQ
jgi:hypothetical protein